MIRPFARARRSRGNHRRVNVAEAGKIGAEQAPIRLRAATKAHQSDAPVANARPAAPVRPANKAEPRPIAVRDRRGPSRSLSQPPGVMNSV